MTGDTPATHAGFVAIIGAPNAGKSTLLNRLVGQKISITSPKPQTTRMRIMGLAVSGRTQIGFLDTPGIFAPKRRLDTAMVSAAWQALADADAVLLLVDASAVKHELLDEIIAELKRRNVTVTAALNKIDATEKGVLLPLAAQLQASGVVSEIFMISALKKEGIDDILQHLAAKMPAGPWFFEGDQLSDLPSQLLAAEITREQLYRQLQQELPYAATVVPVSWETKPDGSFVIRQHIVIDRAAHKPIVLGKGGTMIKAIGAAARRDIEKFLDAKAHLFLEVKLDEKWQDRPEFYRMFGLEFGGKDAGKSLKRK